MKKIVFLWLSALPFLLKGSTETIMNTLRANTAIAIGAIKSNVTLKTLQALPKTTSSKKKGSGVITITENSPIYHSFDTFKNHFITALEELDKEATHAKNNATEQIKASLTQCLHDIATLCETEGLAVSTYLNSNEMNQYGNIKYLRNSNNGSLADHFQVMILNQIGEKITKVRGTVESIVGKPKEEILGRDDGKFQRDKNYNEGGTKTLLSFGSSDTETMQHLKNEVMIKANENDMAEAAITGKSMHDINSVQNYDEKRLQQFQELEKETNEVAALEKAMQLAMEENKRLTQVFLDTVQQTLQSNKTKEQEITQYITTAMNTIKGRVKEVTTTITEEKKKTEDLLSTTENNIAAYSKKYTELESEIKILEEKIATITDSINKKTEEVATLEALISEMKSIFGGEINSKSTIENRTSALTQEQTVLNNQLQETEQKIASHKKSLEEIENNNTTLKTTLEQEKVKESELKAVGEKEKETITTIEKEKQTIAEKIAGTSNEIATLRKEQEELEASTTKLKSAYQEREEAVNRTKEESNKLQEQLVTFTQVAQDEKNKADDINNNIKTVEKEIAEKQIQLNSEKTSWQKRLETSKIQSKIDQLQSYKEHSKATIDETLPKVTKLVNEIIAIYGSKTKQFQQQTTNIEHMMKFDNISQMKSEFDDISQMKTVGVY